VYRVTVAGGFEFLGGISSQDDAATGGCYWGYYGFTRGVFIGDTVYAATQAGVKAASLDSVGSLLGEATFSGTTVPADDCWFIDEPDFIILPVGTGVR
jgi:hypothetical protein